jgi:hypothetical protein
MQSGALVTIINVDRHNPFVDNTLPHSQLSLPLCLDSAALYHHRWITQLHYDETPDFYWIITAFYIAFHRTSLPARSTVEKYKISEAGGSPPTYICFLDITLAKCRSTFETTHIRGRASQDGNLTEWHGPFGACIGTSAEDCHTTGVIS